MQIHSVDGKGDLQNLSSLKENATIPKCKDTRVQ